MRIVGGIIAALLLIAGGALFAVGSFVTNRFPDGELRLPATHIMSPAAAISLGAPSIDQALAPESQDEGVLKALSATDAGPSVSVDIRVRSRTRKPVLLGVAPTRAFESYMSNVPRDVVTGITGTSPMAVSVRRMVGSQPIGDINNVRLDQVAPSPELQQQLASAGRQAPVAPARPAPTRSPIWIHARKGRGWQKLTWVVGPRALTESLVVMNANGSPGIDVDAGFVVDIGVVTRVFSTIRTAGIIALVIAVVLFVLVLRPRRSQAPPAMPGMPPGYGPPMS